MHGRDVLPNILHYGGHYSGVWCIGDHRQRQSTFQEDIIGVYVHPRGYRMSYRRTID